MEITNDPGKNEINIQTRGLPFDMVLDFDWSSALVNEDIHKDYGERRYQALGFIGERLFVVVFTPRAGKVHVISLRKANTLEVKRYA